MSTFQHGKNIYHFVKPNKLMLKHTFSLIQGNVIGSTLCWNIEGGRLTYKQMQKKVHEYIKENGKCNVLDTINNYHKFTT